MRQVSFAVSLFPYARWGGVPAIVAACRRAEALGYAAVGLPEHVAMPVHESAGEEVDVWYDTAVLAATIAAATSRLRLSLNAAVIPYRHPVDTAQRLATLDQVSRGRITLVAGTGWLRREFRALGVDFAARGALTDEYLRAIRALWTEDHPAFEGQHVAFPPLHAQPRCVQQPTIPIWVGGSSGRPAPLRRAARLGDGWAPANPIDADAGRVDLEFLAAERERCGRAHLPFTVAYSMQLGELDSTTARSRAHVGRAGRSGAEVVPPVGAEQARAEVARLVECGADQIGILFDWRSPAHYADQLAAFAEEVMPWFTDS